MTLAIDQKTQIVQDMALDKSPSIKGKKADEYRKKLQPDFDLAEKMGWHISIQWIWRVSYI